VNCIDYYPGGDKPYLISGADDKTVRIWDYQTKACVQQLEGHTNNVCSCLFHPRLPILVSASEDGTVRIWHATTYRAETTLNYGMERAWALAVTASSNKLAIGYDDGTIMITLGNEVGSREDDGTFSFSGGGGGGGIDRASDGARHAALASPEEEGWFPWSLDSWVATQQQRDSRSR
jgi:coatomer subunit beta'